MKKIFMVMLLAAANQAAPAFAGLFDGGGPPVALESTQMMNNAELVSLYAQQGQQYASELNRERIMIQNALANPLGVTLPDVRRLATDIGRLQSAGADIGNSMAQVDANFASRFNNPLALTYSDKFKHANDGSMAAIRESMQSAGLQRENFHSDTDAVSALTDSLLASQGTNGTLQALGAINAAQLNDSIKTRDLLSSQQLATNTWMAQQTAKQQAAVEINKNLLGAQPTPIPSLDLGTSNRIEKWNLYSPR